MLTLDPGNTYALLMQGKNMLESGDAAGAVTTLQKVSDVDSHPDGLRDLLKAYLQSGQLSEAGTVANKLLTVHNDLAAIASFADALMQAGQYETALQVFDQHAERLLAENSDKVLECLHTIIGHVRDNPDSLQKLLDLFHKAGENTHVSEVIELLAHASVQAGDLPRARDLYQRLATVEPQNPLHMQNYQQVVGQIGGTSGGKMITPEEAVVLIDDLEATAPSIHQHYTDEIALAVRSALTDAELFISYNMPAKALGPLVGALPLAPNDLRLNQRLAALHTRAGRFAEAALCCRTLQTVYSDADHPDEATRYGELAERYEERSSAPAPAAPVEDSHIFLDAAPQVAEPAAETASEQTSEPESAVPEFAIDEVPAEEPASQPEAASTQLAAPTPQAASPWPTAQPEFSVEAAAEPAAAAEIDLSSEWDDSVTVESDAPAVEAIEQAPAAPVQSAAPVASHKVSDSGKTDETIEEIRFYLAHGMPEQAMAALAKLQTLTNDKAKLAQLRSEVDAATQAAAEQEAAAAAEPVIEELTADDIPTLEVAAEELPVEEVPAGEVAVEAHAAAVPVVAQPEPPAVQEIPIVAEAPAPAAPEPVVHATAPEPPPAPGVLNEFVSDLESSLGDTFLPGTVAKPTTAAAAPPVAMAPAAHTEPVITAAPNSAVLGEFVADIEASLGEDFSRPHPSRKHPRQQPQRSLRRCLPRQDLPRLRLRWSLHESLRRLPRVLLHPPPPCTTSRPLRLQVRPSRRRPWPGMHPLMSPSRSRLSFRLLTLLPPLRPLPSPKRLGSTLRRCLENSSRISKLMLLPPTRIPKHTTTSASPSAKWDCSTRLSENCRKPANRSITGVPSGRSCRHIPGWPSASSKRECRRPRFAGTTKL